MNEISKYLPLDTSSIKRIIGGTAGSLGVVWMSRKIANWTRTPGNNEGLHIGTLFDKIMPIKIKSGFKTATNFVQTYAVRLIGRPIANYLQSRALTDIIVAPIIEETVYRYGLPTAIAKILEACGLNTTIGKVIGISIASFIFGMAHETDLKSERFMSTMIPGIIYALVKEYGNLPESMIVHAIENAIEHYK